MNEIIFYIYNVAIDINKKEKTSNISLIDIINQVILNIKQKKEEVKIGKIKKTIQILDFIEEIDDNYKYFIFNIETILDDNPHIKHKTTQEEKTLKEVDYELQEKSIGAVIQHNHIIYIILQNKKNACGYKDLQYLFNKDIVNIRTTPDNEMFNVNNVVKKISIIPYRENSQLHIENILNFQINIPYSTKKSIEDLALLKDYENTFNVNECLIKCEVQPNTRIDKKIISTIFNLKKENKIYDFTIECENSGGEKFILDSIKTKKIIITENVSSKDAIKKCIINLLPKL